LYLIDNEYFDEPLEEALRMPFRALAAKGKSVLSD